MTKRYGGASYYTKLRKQVKRQQRIANTRARKLSKTVYGKGNYALKNNYNNGKGFDISNVKTVNGLRAYNAKINRFLSSKTSTVGGSRNVLRGTMKNILNGGREFTSSQNQALANLIDSGAGNVIAEKYFDVYYKVKDILSSQHLASAYASNDIMKQITEELDSQVVSSESPDVNINVVDDQGNATSTNQPFAPYSSVDLVSKANVLSSAELAMDVINKLKGM